MSAAISLDKVSSVEKISFFSCRNLSAGFIRNEYIIAGVATAVFSSAMVAASGGALSAAFFAARIIQGTVVCFFNHNLSEIGITVITNCIGRLFSFIDDSVEGIASFKASIDTIRSTTFFKIVRTSVNIFLSIAAFATTKGSDSLYLINLCISLSGLFLGVFLLKAKKISENILTTYAYIKNRDIRRQMGLVFQPRFNFKIPGFLRTFAGDIQGRVDQGFQNLFNQLYLEKKQVGDSREILRRIIISYRISLGQNSREREAFEDEYEKMDANAFKAIALETVFQIVSLLSFSFLSFNSYPSFILKEQREEFKSIHKQFQRLPLHLQKEVKETLHSARGPDDMAARVVWEAMRSFSYEKMVKANPIFNAAIQEVLSGK